MSGGHVLAIALCGLPLCLVSAPASAQQDRARPAGAAVAARTADGARIVDVIQLPPAVEAQTRPGAPGGRYMPKFVRERSVAGPRYAIVWRPPPGGLRDGATVVFEYRLAGRAEPARRTVSLNCPISGQQETVVAVPAAVSEPIVVEAWRAAVYAGRSLLAERVSLRWRTRT